MLLALWQRLRRLGFEKLLNTVLAIVALLFFGRVIYLTIFGLQSQIEWYPIPLYPRHKENIVNSETPTEQSLRFTTADAVEDIVEWYDNEFNPRTRYSSDRIVQQQNSAVMQIEYQLCTGMLITLTVTQGQTLQEVALVQHKRYPRGGGLCSRL